MKLNRSNGISPFIGARLILPALVVAIIYFCMSFPVLADGPTVQLVNPLVGPTQVTQPVTGSAPNLVSVENVLESVTTVESGTGVSPDDFTAVNKEYTKFEVRQTALTDLSGTLEVRGDNFGKSTPYKASAGDNLAAHTIFPGETGEYTVRLTEDSHQQPIMVVSGDLQQTSNGEYRHRLISGFADPDFLSLDPEEFGLIISVGFVKAKLASCLQLNEPIDGTYELGVDQNGDSNIDEAESITLPLNNQFNSCVETPEANIPLTSHYKAEVTMANGVIVARNNGLYDFLNKSGVESTKEALTDLVKEFKVEWFRIPVAASIAISNASIRPPAVDFIAIPEVEEVTGDIIQNGPDTLSDQYQSDEIEDSEIDESSSLDDNFLIDFFLNNWIWLALATSAVVATVFVVKGSLPRN